VHRAAVGIARAGAAVRHAAPEPVHVGAPALEAGAAGIQAEGRAEGRHDARPRRAAGVVGLAAVGSRARKRRVAAGGDAGPTEVRSGNQDGERVAAADDLGVGATVGAAPARGREARRAAREIGEAALREVWGVALLAPLDHAVAAAGSADTGARRRAGPAAPPTLIVAAVLARAVRRTAHAELRARRLDTHPIISARAATASARPTPLAVRLARPGRRLALSGQRQRHDREQGDEITSHVLHGRTSVPREGRTAAPR